MQKMHRDALLARVFIILAVVNGTVATIIVLRDQSLLVAAWNVATGVLALGYAVFLFRQAERARRTRTRPLPKHQPFKAGE